MDTLEGKTAVVTGGASGMGRAFCGRFATAGMRVVVADVEQGPLDAAVAELRAAGADALGVRCDVSSSDDNDAVLAAALDAYGQVNVVCLNAGVGGANGKSWNLTLDDWRWTLDVNLWGVVNGVRTFVPHLVDHGDGHVVTTASIAGHTSSPYGAPYNVTKHGVVTLTETLYNELQREGSTVGVTCLCPGFVATNILSSDRNRPGGRPERTGERDRGGARFAEVVKKMIDNGKPPDEVADLVHDAIVSNQFWLFTDDVWDDPIARRHAEILEAQATDAAGTEAPMTIPDGVLGVVAHHRADSEAARHLHPASVEAMRGAGLFRLMTPQRSGGDEAGFAAMVETVRTVGRADGAAGWVLMVCVAHDWIIGSFAPEAQADVYEQGPDAVVPGSLAPAGTAAGVDGGWRISGRWPFASGAVHGDWYLLGTAEPASEGRPRLLHVVVPRGDIVVDDNWHPIGLRGTGSCDVVADEVFVPAHRTIDTGLLLSGRSEHARIHATDLYRTPIMPGLTGHLAAAALGIAGPAFDHGVELLGEQADRYTATPKSDRPGAHMRLAESATELRTAELLVDDTVGLLATAAGGDDTKDLRARAKYQAAYSLELCRRAIDRVFVAAGARAAFDGSRLQQGFRDLTMASRHAAGELDGIGQAYGRTLLGQPPGPHPL